MCESMTCYELHNVSDGPHAHSMAMARGLEED